MFEVHKDIMIEKYSTDKRSFEELLKDIRINIISYDENSLEFDLIGVDCSIANAIRRILIAEVPTIAIEKVIIYDYNCVIPEEIISHRLGLLPICIDPRMLQFKGDEINEENTLKFELKVSYENRKGDPITVMSDQIVWVPLGNQLERFKNANCIPYVKKGIPIAKLCSGQKIAIEMFCEKNIGKEHAKWTPVCPVSYRLHPIIKIIDDIYDDEAKKLQGCFSKGVIDLIKMNDGRLKALVANERIDMVSREVLRHKEFDGRVFLGRKPNHFIFNMETVFIDPILLVKQSFAVMKYKCDILKQELEDAFK